MIPSFFGCLLPVSLRPRQTFTSLQLFRSHSSSAGDGRDPRFRSTLRLRPDAGEAHMARARTSLFRGYLDHDGALAELEIARRTLPNDPRVFELTGYIVRRRGRHDEGLRYLNRALDNIGSAQLFYPSANSSQLRGSPTLQRRNCCSLFGALDIKPDDVETRVARASVDFDARADTRPLHQTLASARAKFPAAMEDVAVSWFNCALAERDSGLLVTL